MIDRTGGPTGLCRYSKMSNKQLANSYSLVQFRSIFLHKYFTKYPRMQVTATQVLTLETRMGYFSS